MDYSKENQQLIDRMCQISERASYVLEKKSAQETILKTYDLFNLPRPKKIVWHKDLDDIFLDSASSASSAYSAYSASSAFRAYSASSTSIDYDFDWFVLVHEYNKANTDGNEHDRRYLEYSNLLLQAKELGVGHWCDYDDTLHLVALPLVKYFPGTNRFHSTTGPAVHWLGGTEIYILNGVELEKKLWEKIVSGTMSAKEVFAIENTEHRRVAYEVMDKSKMLDLGAETLDERKDDGYGHPDRVISFTVQGFDEPFRYYHCFCPSTGREYFLQTEEKTCIRAKAKSFGFENVVFSKEY